MATIKQQRVAQGILQRLSEIFLYEISDPRLGGLSVTEVQIDRELAHCHVYVGTANDEDEEIIMNALQKASGYLKRELSKSITLRSMPQLYYHWDPTLASAERVNNMLDGLNIPEVSIVDESAYVQPKNNDDLDDDFDLDEFEKNTLADEEDDIEGDFS